MKECWESIIPLKSFPLFGLGGWFGCWIDGSHSSLTFPALCWTTIFVLPSAQGPPDGRKRHCGRFLLLSLLLPNAEFLLTPLSYLTLSLQIPYDYPVSSVTRSVEIESHWLPECCGFMVMSGPSLLAKVVLVRAMTDLDWMVGFN